MKNMNKKIIIIVLLFGMFSCDEYLDIVPDQTQQIDLLFDRKEVAYTALATCYAYLPKNDGVYTSFMMMSDEVTTPIAKETDGIRIMKGQQSASNPKFGLWSGWSDQGSLWEGIRHCNILIENIYNVVDMTEQEMNSWAAEAKFLKAYYHFTAKYAERSEAKNLHFQVYLLSFSHEVYPSRFVPFYGSPPFFGERSYCCN